MTAEQARQGEWHDQWSMFLDDARFLFEEWIFPNRLEDFSGKDVLEAGCGGGQHSALVAPLARSLTSVDLNTADIARRRNPGARNIEFLEADVCSLALPRQFDVVFSIGVLHHTDDPDRAARNLARHVKPGGRLILWVYSQEGNALVRHLVEPARKRFLARTDRRRLRTLSRLLSATLFPVAQTVYRLPLPFLPYFEYLGNYRRLSFERNTLNVFDKLNAPQTRFIPRSQVESWLPETEFEDRHLSWYKKVSWRASGTKRAAPQPAPTRHNPDRRT